MHTHIQNNGSHTQMPTDHIHTNRDTHDTEIHTVMHIHTWTHTNTYTLTYTQKNTYKVLLSLLARTRDPEDPPESQQLH